MQTLNAITGHTNGCSPYFLHTPLILLPALLCMAVLHGSAALAETVNLPPATSLETEDDFIGEIDTVISATRIRQPLTESPASITVIDRNMIEASGAVEIADVLRLVPGIQVAYPQGNLIASTYHGYADSFPRNMQVLVDGRSIYQASFADVDWLSLGVTLEEIERIEVIRGPNTPMYGANAVRGVINIITRQPYQDRGTYARFTAGDLNTRNAVLRHGSSISDLDYRVTLSYQENDGLEGNLDSTNDDRRISGVSARGIWHPHPRDEIDLQLGYSSGSMGAGAEPTHDPPPHDKDIESHYQYINWRTSLDNEADISWKFYHNAYESDDSYRDLISHAAGLEYPDEWPFPFPDQVADFDFYDFENERYNTELQYTSPHSGRWRAVAGIGVRLDRLKSEVLTGEDDWIDEWSTWLSANLEYRASRQLLFNVGAIAEDSDQSGGYLSPRLAVNWLFSDDQSIRTSYARAKRKPSLLEGHIHYVYRLDNDTPYFTGFTSAEPGHETVTALELGYVGYWLDRRLLVDLKLFREEADDLIHDVRDLAQPQPDGIPTFMNDGSTDVTGGELQLKYQTGPRDFVALQYSHLDADIRRRGTINPSAFRNDEERAPPHPQHTASLLASRGLPDNFEVSAGFYWISEMEWLGDGQDIDGYTRLDTRVAKTWRAGGSRMQLEGIVQNIGGDYATFRNENIFDTRAYVRFSIAFQ